MPNPKGTKQIVEVSRNPIGVAEARRTPMLSGRQIQSAVGSVPTSAVTRTKKISQRAASRTAANTKLKKKNSWMKHLRKVLAVAIVSGFLLILVPNISSARGTAGFREEPQPSRNRSSIPQTQVERLRRVMLPLVKATDHPRRLQQIAVKIIDEPRINAASAGNGEFYVTTGLLNRANDEQLRGVLAHEVAHDDLGHPAKAQLIGTGLGLGLILLERLMPGTSGVAPVAGALVAQGYSRPQEYEADRHAVEILARAGYAKDTMANALSWLMKIEGDSGGGILSTHPATSDRIRALRALR
ncbi:MAG TPA: M48 family metallopeptidase [Candidatus Udaeobacter sp.]|nr:M48 family metallopeptidase [Candidatus Udaeobacter sp.]